MSKSLGNFVTIHELLHSGRFGGRAWSGEILRLAMLRTNYRQPIDFTAKALEEAERTLERWRFAAGEAAPGAEIADGFLAALDDDLNTPAAIAELHRLAQAGEPAALKASAAFLGLLVEPGVAAEAPDAAESDRIAVLLQARATARARKDWAESDRLRDALAAMGVVVKDNRDGATTWEIRR
jgi:cysteinyl-tRNA synthetase